MGRLVRIFKNNRTGELSSYPKNLDFKPTIMVFDTDTQTVFYKFTEVVTVCSINFSNQEIMDTKVGYMCPYIGKHGRPCRFINEKIVETD